MDLHVVRADRDLHPVDLTADGLECAGNRRFADAVQAQHVVARRRRSLEQPPHRLGLERAGPEPLQLRRRAGKDDRDAVPRSSTMPGAVPASPSDTPPSGSVACLRIPGSKSTNGRRNRVAMSRETLRISASSSGSTRRLRPATRARISTVRSSCVGPSPPDTSRRSARRPSRRASSRSSSRSPTMEIRAGSKPRRSASRAKKGPLRSLRSPRTSSLPVATTTARSRLKPRRGSAWRSPRRSSGSHRAGAPHGAR